MNEEKERYKWGYNGKFLKHYILDTETKEQLGYEEIFDLLNQQDEEIKDLRNDNEWLCDERQKLRKYVDGLIEKNKQLKQSQKQLGIDELEKIKEFCETWKYCDNDYDFVIVKEKSGIRCVPGLYEHINNQIKQLEAQNEV